MRRRSIWFALALGLGLSAGCWQSQTSGESATGLAKGLDVGAGGTAPHEADPSDPQLECNEYQAAAQELLTTAQACVRDEDCTGTEIDAPCLLAFLCSTSLNRAADLEHVRSEAARLSAAYRACSNSCWAASCVAGAETKSVCNPGTHRCEFDLSSLRAL